MGVAGLTYPITIEVLGALRRLPRIAEVLGDIDLGRSDLEVIRLLGNTHYEGIARVLEFIEQNARVAAPIVRKALETKDPIQLDQALAELYLFGHLHRNLGDQVSASEAAPGVSRPDIEIRCSGLTTLCEVFCPIDFMGFQIVQRYATSALKHLDIEGGYHLDIELLPTREHDVQYAYNIGDEEEVKPWLLRLVDQAKSWLANPSAGSRLAVVGARASWKLNLELRQFDARSSERLIIASSGTRSTDTRLFFECGTAEATYRSEWGNKLRRKLRKRQCGNREPGKLRILAVDFSLADTGWPDFISWPNIHDRLRRVIQITVENVGGELPYDAVLPAQLDIVPGFADMIWLREASPSEREFIAAAGLTDSIKHREGNQDFSDLLD